MAKRLPLSDVCTNIGRMSEDIIEAEPLALLAELDGVLDKLRTTDLTVLSGRQLIDFTRSWERFTRRSVTVQHAAVAELDARRSAGETGHASTAALLGDLLRINPGQARRRIRDAAEFGPRRGLSGEPLPPVLPQTADALTDGSIGIEHARAISDLVVFAEHMAPSAAEQEPGSRP